MAFRDVQKFRRKSNNKKILKHGSSMHVYVHNVHMLPLSSTIAVFIIELVDWSKTKYNVCDIKTYKSRFVSISA